MDWLVPLIWFFVAILFIIIEASTFNLFTIWFAFGAIAAMLIALIVPEWLWLQILIFLGISILMIFTIRNFAMKKFKANTIKTNVNSLIGKKVVVTDTIEEFKFGAVKVDGNFWTAKSLNGETIEKDSIVEIVEVSGVKLIVRKI